MDTRVEPKLETSFCGMAFNTPLVLLSGCVGFGEEYTRVAGFSNREVGAICLKGTTGQPRLGKPPHQIARADQQIEDIEQGIAPSNAVAIKRLSAGDRDRLRAALSAVAHLKHLTRDLLFRH